MWDERAAPHTASPGYAVEQLVADPERPSDVVRFDRLPRLGTSWVRAGCTCCAQAHRR